MVENTRPVSNWPEKPLAGVCIHFSSLPSPFGIGDIGDAALRFVDTLAELKLGVWQFLPIGPTGFGDSPYQALSAFAGNEMLIGLDPLLRQGYLEKRELSALEALPENTTQYESLIPLKRTLLNQAAKSFSKNATKKQKAAFEQFCEQADSCWLHDYSLFRVLKAQNGDVAWSEWPAKLANRDGAALARIEARHGQEIGLVKIIQFFFDQQWQTLREHAQKRGIRLFGDIPIYIALDSADAWAGRGLLQTDASGRPTHVAGVPPDYFSEDGQLWGNPLYDWKSQKKTGYGWWFQRMEQAASRYDMVRIDHFRGLESYWSIPAGEKTAVNGRWLAGPGDDFLGMVGNPGNGLAIVAEDLGMITRSVTRLRKRHGLPGMRVLQFELFDPDCRLDEIPEDCVCYTGTHDNDTIVGWFSGSSRDDAARREAKRLRQTALSLTRGSSETLHLDLVQLAFSTRARVAIAPMQDFLGLGSEARLNNPGTSVGNWRWRLTDEQLTPAIRADIVRIVEACSRAQP